MVSLSVVESDRLHGVERWDAEYFRPQFLQLADSLESVGCESLASYVDTISRGCAPEYDPDGTVPVVRTVNVRPLEFSTARREYVRAEFYSGNSDGQIRTGDIAITSTGLGTLGRVFCNQSKREYFGDGHITILRLKDKEDGPFLAAVLQSAVGAMQFEQRQRGSSGQIEIYLQDILDVKIPAFSPSKKKKLAETWSDAVRDVERSDGLYPEAETELLSRIGWVGLQKVEPELFYVRDADEIYASGRNDAEFYHPQYVRLRAKLARSGMTLGALAERFDKGTQPPGYTPDGEVTVVKSKQVTGRELVLEDCERTDLSVYSDESARLKPNDFVIIGSCVTNASVSVAAHLTGYE
jgi:hypothetical protein